MRKLLTTALAAFGLALPLRAQILYVDANAAAGGDGSSWTLAYKTIQPALAAATPGTTIWVAAQGGFYTGPFNVPAGVTMLGAFLGNNQTTGTPGSISTVQRAVQNRTVLSGGGTSRVLTLGAGSRVDGFWVQFGQAAAPGGGGALIDGVDATISNCFFQLNNDGAGSGAALLVRNGANPRIENCAFFFNGDAQSGAAIEVDGASGTFVNLTVDANTNSGLRCANGATPSIRSSIFSDNGSRGIEQSSTAANPTVAYNLFFNNAVSHYLHGANELSTAAQINALAFASNNIEGDPLFLPTPRDYRLQPSSPAVDAGDPAAAPQRPQGLYDQSRILDGDLDGAMRVDIGAAEFSNATLLIPVDIHRHVHIGVGGTSGLAAFLVISVAPLPPVLAPPVGYVFVNPTPGLAITVPYASIPTPGSQVLLYPPSLPSGVALYVQAIGTNFVGANISNPAVHITN